MLVLGWGGGGGGGGGEKERKKKEKKKGADHTPSKLLQISRTLGRKMDSIILQWPIWKLDNLR